MHGDSSAVSISDTHVVKVIEKFFRILYHVHIRKYGIFRIIELGRYIPWAMH